MQTAHSEYLKLDTVYLKTVRDGFVSQQQLNSQWAALNYIAVPEFERSIREYNDFENLLLKHEINVVHFPEDSSTSIDAVYCRDASIATDHGLIICEMGKATRKTETQAQYNTYLNHNLPVLGKITLPGTLEGGDVAWVNEKTLAVGLSYRTNAEGIQQLRALLSPVGIDLIVVDLPHYKGPEDVFHLMSIFSPVDKDLAVIYPPLMPVRFMNQLVDMGYNFVTVPETEFDSMGCNVLAIAPRKCIMVDGNPITRSALEHVGCVVQTYAGREISIKGGGGPTCLTRPISRLK